MLGVRIAMAVLFSMGMAMLALAQVPPASHPAACERRNDRPFKVFSLLAYREQPDMAAYGMLPAHIIDRDLWAPGVKRSEAPDPAAIRKVLADLPQNNGPIILDIEDFPLDGDPRVSDDSIMRLQRILRAVRKEARGRTIGFYSIVPVRDYWRRIKGRNSPEFKTWQRDNDRTLTIEREVDVIMPSIYTLYEDRAGWQDYAVDQICEARRLSKKPVYVFMWPEYDNPAYNGREVDADYWRMELETAYRYADGIVLWSGADVTRISGMRPWNPQAPWWLETERFLRTIANQPRSRQPVVIARKARRTRR